MSKESKSDEIINTNSYILTFNNHQISNNIKIRYEKINIETYIPNPFRDMDIIETGVHALHYA